MFFKRKRLRYRVATGLAAGLCSVALYAQLLVFMQGKYIHIGNILFYFFLIILFVIRMEPIVQSTSVKHWFFAIGGSFTPLFLVPAENYNFTLFAISIPFTVLGMSFSIISLLYLGRSFGVIASKRKIKVNGPYKYVRHPMYLGEALWFSSILIYNPSLLNMAIFIVNISCQLQRIKEEEKVLITADSYILYRQRVKYRLIPGFY